MGNDEEPQDFLAGSRRFFVSRELPIIIPLPNVANQISVLIVEDSEPDAELAVHELSAAGYRVNSKRVETEQDFLDALGSGSWTVILSDYSMPGFNGLTALRLCKERSPGIPFIFVSGVITEEMAVTAMRMGAHDYVMKSNLKRLAPAVEREIREADERREKNALVAERTKIEEAMRRKDALFRSLIQHSSDGILLLGKDGTISYHSASAARILGCTSGEQIPRTFFEIIDEEDLPRARKFINDLAASPDRVVAYETRVKCPDGSRRWIEAAGHNLMSDENVGAIVLNYRDITDRKIADEEVRRSRQQLRALTANLENAREEERKHLTREFHDELGQSLTALRLGLTLLHRGLTEHGRELSPESIDEEIRSMRREIERATHSVRKTLSKLRPELLDQLGVLAALTWDAERFQKRSGITCAVRSNVEEVPLDPKSSITLFRIYQEAMTNIIRHSQATSVEVRVWLEGDELTLTIHDNGIGIDSGANLKPDSFGLIGMRERALLLNGAFDIRGGSNEGTTIVVRVPIMQTAVGPERQP